MEDGSVPSLNTTLSVRFNERNASKGMSVRRSNSKDVSPSSSSSTTTGAGPNVSAVSGFANTETTAISMDVMRGSPARGLGGLGFEGRRKPSGEPRPSMQDFVKIKSVFDIYQAVRTLAAMIGNCWSGVYSTVSCYRQVVPGLVRVHVGTLTYTLPGFLLQDLEPMLTKPPKASVASRASQDTDPTVADVYCRCHTPYFEHIIVLLKLRWLLRMGSACCELDYRMLSCSNLIKGLQHVALQQCAETEADCVFDSKVSQQVGSHMNIESVVNDIFDQLQRALGAGWRAFLEYVSTCDPRRSVLRSRMERAPPQVVSNESLMTVVDTIFVTCFLRAPRKATASDLRECYDHIEMLGLPLPELPPLRGAQNLRSWAKAKTKPTRQDRFFANKIGKDIEKLAQLDAVILCAALELKLPEVMATEEELADMDFVTSLPNSVTGNVAPQPADFSCTGRAETTPPAAMAIMSDRPQCSPQLFNAAVHAVHHHITFPAGIRERLYSLLVEDYDLTLEQSERLTIAVTQNIDGKRLSKAELIKMELREKKRICKYAGATHSDCSHLLVAPLVAPPSEKHKPAKHTFTPPKVERIPLLGSAFGSSEFTRSLPDMRGLVAKGIAGQDLFKVSMATGPLTVDPDSRQLRTTGLFSRMSSIRCP
mmetsp:Transcript_41093/g.113215  ORF Transcript_41093/g.113215 Transcript_41093/m.113215 type:complete len:651 (+) Transcript_41093:236-2188(+)